MIGAIAFFESWVEAIFVQSETVEFKLQSNIAQLSNRHLLNVT